MSRTATTTSTLTSTRFAKLSLRGADDTQRGYQYSGALAPSTHRRVNPVLGERFDSFDLKAVFDQSATERDAILRDIAILVARRGVVVFKRQDNFPPEQLGELVHRLGQLTGKPSTSHLHIHPLNPGEYNEDGSRKQKGGEKITTAKDSRGAQISAPDERSDFASYGWHADITFEPVPADFTVLRMSQIPECGGDTMFASAYEAYDRLSPSMKVFLEGLTATHDAAVFRKQAERYNFKLFAGPRGCPEDVGEEVCTTHPVIMTHPITGWKALFVNRTFTTRINELKKDESDLILSHLFRLFSDNHDLQARHTWDQNDVVIWDNRSVQHSATWDFGDAPRSGDRAVSLGGRITFDPRSRSRRDAIAAGEIA